MIQPTCCHAHWNQQHSGLFLGCLSWFDLFKVNPTSCQYVLVQYVRVLGGDDLYLVDASLHFSLPGFPSILCYETIGSFPAVEKHMNRMPLGSDSLVTQGSKASVIDVIKSVGDSISVSSAICVLVLLFSLMVNIYFSYFNLLTVWKTRLCQFATTQSHAAKISNSNSTKPSLIVMILGTTLFNVIVTVRPILKPCKLDWQYILATWKSF